MDTHEFGIMDTAPTDEQEFNDYEPQKYNCVSVEDDSLLQIQESLALIPCYWHSLKQKEKGLAYFGITLIPPQSLSKFISAVDGKAQFKELKALFKKADNEKKYVIHFGI